MKYIIENVTTRFLTRILTVVNRYSTVDARRHDRGRCLVSTSYEDDSSTLNSVISYILESSISKKCFTKTVVGVKEQENKLIRSAYIYYHNSAYLLALFRKCLRTISVQAQYSFDFFF